MTDTPDDEPEFATAADTGPDGLWTQLVLKIPVPPKHRGSIASLVERMANNMQIQGVPLISLSVDDEVTTLELCFARRDPTAAPNDAELALAAHDLITREMSLPTN